MVSPSCLAVRAALRPGGSGIPLIQIYRLFLLESERLKATIVGWRPFFANHVADLATPHAKNRDLVQRAQEVEGIVHRPCQPGLERDPPIGGKSHGGIDAGALVRRWRVPDTYQ